jgi:hypothetical protein
VKLEIVSATVICLKGSTDKVVLGTNLPESLWPFSGHAVLSLEVSQGNGERYVQTHFPAVPVRVVKG